MNRDEIRVAHAGASLIVAHMIGQRPVGVRRNVGERDPPRNSRMYLLSAFQRRSVPKSSAISDLRQGLRRERPAV
jgi:hypothetical protein